MTFKLLQRNNFISNLLIDWVLTEVQDTLSQFSLSHS